MTGSALMNPVGPTGTSGMNPRGVYSSSQTYNKGDTVLSTSTGSPYWALANGLTGSSHDPATDNINWMQLALPASVAFGSTSTTAAVGNDARLKSIPPVVNGFKLWNADCATAPSSSAPSSGMTVLSRIYAPSPDTFSSVCVGQITASSGLTYAGVGLYDTSGNQLAVSADLHTTWTGAPNGLLSGALTSSYNWPGGAGAFLYVAFLMVGTPGALLKWLGPGTGSNVNIGNSTAGAWRQMTLTGQTTLPSTLTLSSFSQSVNTLWWVGLQ